MELTAGTSALVFWLGAAALRQTLLEAVAAGWKQGNKVGFGLPQESSSPVLE